MSTQAFPERRTPESFAILRSASVAIWGFQQVAIKSTNAVMPPIFQAGLRSLQLRRFPYGPGRVRAVCCSFATTARSVPGWPRAFYLPAEFVCIFLGLTLTSASRMAVFLYTAPYFTALGLHFFVDGKRMWRIQWIGIVVAFAGMALAFADGFLHNHTAHGAMVSGAAGDRARRARRSFVSGEHGRGAS